MVEHYPAERPQTIRPQISDHNKSHKLNCDLFTESNVYR